MLNNLIFKLKSKSIKSILYLLILYVTSILGFGKFLLVAYFQLPESYGMFILLIGVIILIGSFISVGEIEKTIKEYPTNWITKQFDLINESISRLLLLMFLRALLVIFIYVIYAYIMEQEVNLIILTAAFFIMFNHSVNPIFTSLFRSSSSLSFFAYSQLARTLLSIIILTVAAYNYSWEGLLVAEALSSILIFPIYLFFINRQFSEEKIKFKIAFKIEKEIFINIFKPSSISGLYLYLSIMMISIPLYLDKFIIGEFKGPELVGVYGVSFLIVQIGVLINNVLSQKAGPDFIKNKINNRKVNLIRQLINWISVGIVMQLFICVLVLLVLESGLIQYYLPKYNISFDILLVACLLSLFQFNGLTEFALISIDREKMIFVSNILYSLLFVFCFTVIGYLDLDLIFFLCAFIISKIAQLSMQFYFIIYNDRTIKKV